MASSVQSELANSLTEIRYEATDIKTFPLRESALTSNHCQIERVSAVIRRDGRWTISFRATQNPDLVEAERRPKFVRFKQNRFYVTVRAFGDYPLVPASMDGSQAMPELVAIPVEPFWIQQNQQLQLHFSGQCVELKRHFDVIDRLEVDLQYE